MEARTILAVAFGAAIGGAMRFTLTQGVAARFGNAAVPFATLFINVSGSFAIGAVVELLLRRTEVDPLWRAFVAIGILGGYTTFSTFSYESLALVSEGFVLRAFAYAIASVTLGVAGAFAGVWVVRAAT